ncbi:MAG: alpha/beta fold hydrolase [Dehalococcoidia bacterium]
MEEFITSGNALIWTETTGAGPGLLLANGGPGCCDYLGPVAAMVDDVACVTRFEQRGCGRSSHEEVYTLEQCLADMEAVREARGYDRWAVGGHSWGADIALIYALTYPDRVTAVIGIAGGRLVNDRLWSEAYHRNKDERGEFEPEQAYPPNLEVNRQLNAAARRYIQRPELWRDVARLDVPALFVWGSDDIRPSWPTEQIASLMPRARFERIDGAAHVIWHSHAVGLRDLLRAFLSGLDGVGR